MTNLYVFFGYKGSGKSIAAEYVIAKTGAHLLPFKTKLVEELNEHFFEIQKELLKDQPKKEPRSLYVDKPEIWRHIMCAASDLIHKLRPTYIEDDWERRFLEVYPETVVVDDCRRIAQFDKVEKYNPVLIRINRTDITTGGDHATETDIDQITPDYTLTVGKGEHDKLYAELDKILHEL